MTDTYHFEGFDTPKENWTKTPNGIIEAMSHMSGAEFKCVMYVVRHTWGFHQDERRITLDEFVSGRRKKDRSRMDEGTGLSRPTVIKALRAAEKHGFLISETDNYDAARIRKTYGLKIKESNNLTSEVKKDNRRSQESIPRSEKETKKETKKEATEKTPVAPPPKNPEQPHLLPPEQQAELIFSGEEKNTTTPNAEAEQASENPLQGKSVVPRRPDFLDLAAKTAQHRTEFDDFAHGPAIQAHREAIQRYFAAEFGEDSGLPPLSKRVLKQWDRKYGVIAADISGDPDQPVEAKQVGLRVEALAQSKNAAYLFKPGGTLTRGPFLKGYSAMLAGIPYQRDNGGKSTVTMPT